MKTLGYIFRYNEDEQMGILAFGQKQGSYWKKPILFSNSHCLSPIKTGQLVYFDLLDDNTAANIERASFLNIKRDVIDNVVNNIKQFNDQAVISYEDISKLYVKNDLQIAEEGMMRSFLNDPDYFEGDRYIYDDPLLYNHIELPNDIISLYSLFGDKTKNKYLFYDLTDSNSINIEILDITYWFEKDMINNKDYDINTANQVLYLFEIFCDCKVDKVTEIWNYVLSNLNSNELKELYLKEPQFQPALPDSFCLENLDLLSEKYGFHSEKICEEYYRYCIKISATTTEYLSLCKIINEAINYKRVYNEDEGVIIFNLNNSSLNELLNLLDNRFLNNISNNLGDSLSSVSNNKIDGCLRVQNLLNNNDKDYLIQMGQFLDFHNEIIHVPVDSFIRRYISDFESLREEDKDYLTIPVKDKVKEIILTVANDTRQIGKPLIINHLINEFSFFINTPKADLLEEVKSIVNQEFSNLDNLDDLKTAYDTGMISQDQYFNQFKNITKDYSINSLLNLISSHDNKGLLEQEYLISKTFSLYNVSSINEYKYVSLGFGYISNLKELFKWFNDKVKFNYIDIDLWKDKEKQLTENLPKEDRWSLFEEGIIGSPLLDNLRERLDKAYQKSSLDDELFKKDCFQEIMVEDLVKETNHNRMFLILDNLDTYHKNKAKEQANEQLIFFIWAYNPDENVDWHKIREYFSLLPYKKQIRLFRYLFYLKATGELSFSISELSEKLTNDESKLCTHLQLILLFLKKKAKDLKSHISTNEIEGILADFIKSYEKFIAFKAIYNSILTSYFSDFFYECHGHLLPSVLNPDIEYFYRNGQIEKVEKDEQLFYVITFYDVQLNYHFERERFAGKSQIYEAISVLERNFPYKLYDNNEYWISADYEIRIKDFVRKYHIDDTCELFDDQNGLFPIHQNYPARYHKSKNFLCKRIKDCYDIDPTHKIQFCWCEKQPCTRIGLFLEPIDNWEDYKFADLLDILYGTDISLRDNIWRANAEISQFLNDYVLDPNQVTSSKQINTQDEIGEWTDNMYIITEEYPEGYYENLDDED